MQILNYKTGYNKNLIKQIKIFFSRYPPLTEDYDAKNLKLIQKDLQYRIKAKNFSKTIKNFDLYTQSMYGCIIGAFIGDSLGSYCEFSSKSQASKMINETMQMNGGGTFNIKPGQLTDDSELAISLAQGIIKNKPGVLDYNLIAEYYIKWFQSIPFDCGMTMRNSFQGFYGDQYKDKYSQEVSLQAFSENQQSLSNGCLMKITPLAIFSHKLDPNNIYKVVNYDVSLTHPNELANRASYIWVQTLVDIINQHKNLKIDNFKNSEEYYQKIAQYCIARAYKFINDNQENQDLLNWWNESVLSDELMQGDRQIGFLKIAWTYGYNLLNKIANGNIKININQKNIFENSYYKTISQIISQGGDTDTNACIVGGMIGALVGYSGIPQQYIEKQADCSIIQTYIENNDLSDNIQNQQLINNICEVRPRALSPYNAYYITKNLIKLAPHDIAFQNIPYHKPTNIIIKY